MEISFGYPENPKDVNAVVHTHSNHATALAIQEMEIPAIHYMVAAGGGRTSAVHLMLLLEPKNYPSML